MYHILKGGCAVLGCPTQNLHFYNINEVEIQTQKHLSIPSVNKQAVYQ